MYKLWDELIHIIRKIHIQFFEYFNIKLYKHCKNNFKAVFFLAIRPTYLILQFAIKYDVYSHVMADLMTYGHLQAIRH